MLRFFSLLVLFQLSTFSVAFAQDWKDREDWPKDFPRPEKTDNSLFYIQRNKNYHTIVYDLNLKEDGQIDKKNPLDNYWKKYGDKVFRKELTWLESWLAYGYRAKRNKDDSFRIKLRAHNERFITLKKIGEAWKAILPINGEDCILNNIYAYADESGIIPDVLHVDLYGINLKTGKLVMERIYD